MPVTCSVDFSSLQTRITAEIALETTKDGDFQAAIDQLNTQLTDFVELDLVFDGLMVCGVDRIRARLDDVKIPSFETGGPGFVQPDVFNGIDSSQPGPHFTLTNGAPKAGTLVILVDGGPGTATFTLGGPNGDQVTITSPVDGPHNFSCTYDRTVLRVEGANFPSPPFPYPVAITETVTILKTGSEAIAALRTAA